MSTVPMSMTTPPPAKRVTREMSDAQRAHYRMVDIRVGIALRVQAHRHAELVRRNAVRQGTEAPGAARHTRGGPRTTRPDHEAVDAEAEVISKAPTTPAAPSKVQKTNEPFLLPKPEDPAEALKHEWTRLFTLAESYPAQAVTSRLSAVAVLHDRAMVAMFEHARVEEHVKTTQVALAALAAKTLLAEKSGTENSAYENSVVANLTPSALEAKKYSLTHDIDTASHLSQRMRTETITLNGALACLMESVDCEARAEMQMAWEASAFAPRRVPNEWPSGSVIGLTGHFTGGFSGNNDPVFATAVPTAPPYITPGVPIAPLVTGVPGTSTPGIPMVPSQASPVKKAQDLSLQKKAAPKRKICSPEVVPKAKPAGNQKGRRAPPRPRGIAAVTDVTSDVTP